MNEGISGLTANFFWRGFAPVLWRFGSLVLALGSNIWIARCLGPEKLGYSGLASSFVSQAALVITLSQEAHLVRLLKSAGSRAEVDNLIRSVAGFRILLVVLVSAVAASTVISSPSLYPYSLCLLGAIASLAALANPFQWILQGFEKTNTILKLTFIQQALAFVGVVVFIRPPSSVGADICISGVALLVTSFAGWFFVLRSGKLWFAFDLGSLRAAVITFWAGRWMFLSGVIIYLYAAAEQPLLAALSGPEVLGGYRTAIQVSTAVGALTGVVPLVLYPKLIDWYNTSPLHLWKQQLRLSLIFFGLGLGAVAVCVPLLLRLHPYVFGFQYQDAAIPSCILLCSKMVVLVNGVFCWGLWAAKRDRPLMLWLGLTACVSLVSNVILIPRYKMLGASYVNFGSEVLILIGSMILSYRLSKVTHGPASKLAL